MSLFPSNQYGRGVFIQNNSTAQQVIIAATRTQITGSRILIPTGGLKVGTKFRWRFNMAKTAAGTATSTFDISVGTAGTTADTARVSFTKPAGTAAADEGVVVIDAIVRSVSATGVIAGEFTLIHNLAATGHATIPVVAVSTISSAFDNTAADLYVSVNITSGASDAITIELVDAEARVPLT